MTTACFLLLLATGLSAAESPTFFIESIDIRGLESVSREIVLAESLLEEGNVYSERQLRDAERRLRRLPFVFDVEMRIERGSAPGAYLLVIQVTETKAWFFGFGANPQQFEGSGVITAGRRWFVGPSGVAHAAANVGGSVDAAIDVGYTMYDLFGRAAVLSLNLRVPVYNTRPGRRGLDGASPQLTFLLPLSSRQALRLFYSLSLYSIEDPEAQTRSRTESHWLETMWQYRSVDDPFFPREGSDVEAGLRFSDLTTLVPVGPWLPNERPEQIPVRSRSAAVEMRGHRYFDVGRQITVGAGLRAQAGRNRFDPQLSAADRSVSGQAEALVSGSLWSEEKARERGPFRWELALGTHLDNFDIGSSVDSRRRTLESYYLRAGIGRRNQWGIYRLVFTVTRFVPENL